MKQDDKACVLLFSGGRDSTIAAVRLTPIVERLVLVTVTSEHLAGIDAVRRRLLELKQHLPASTKWLHIHQPTTLPVGQLFKAPTCLPCHCMYTAIGIILAERLNANSLAFGYTRYQSDWPEQTLYAIERLTGVLTSRKIRLVLPAYNIASKSDAIAELTRYHLSPEALEQKCSRQEFNVDTLEPSHLKDEIAVWEQVLLETLEALGGNEIETIAESFLGDLHDLGPK